jgi:hypothetical protein
LPDGGDRRAVLIAAGTVDHPMVRRSGRSAQPPLRREGKDPPRVSVQPSSCFCSRAREKRIVDTEVVNRATKKKEQGK